MGSVQYDPMLSGVKRVGVNHVITSPLSLGEVTKTISLLGMLGMQGHPHNVSLPAEQLEL